MIVLRSDKIVGNHHSRLNPAFPLPAISQPTFKIISCDRQIDTNIAKKFGGNFVILDVWWRISGYIEPIKKNMSMYVQYQKDLVQIYQIAPPILSNVLFFKSISEQFVTILRHIVGGCVPTLFQINSSSMFCEVIMLNLY